MGGISAKDGNISLFEEIRSHFPHLKSISIWGKGFYGELNLTGLEDLHDITFEETSIEAFAPGLFQSFAKLKGK